MNKPKDFNMEEFEKCYLENYKYLYTVEELGIEKESEREAVSDFENRRYPDWLLQKHAKYSYHPYILTEKLPHSCMRLKKWGT